MANFTGTDHADVLMDGDGDDVLAGLAGNDTLTGGAGNDSLSGDDGDDFLLDASGSNTLLGGIGNDTIQSGGANSSILGGEGDDAIEVGNGSTVTGGTGRDTISPSFTYGGTGPVPTILVTDFVAGALGDRISFFALLSSTPGYTGTNPFGSAGYLRLRQDGLDTVIDWDNDGGANLFVPLMRLTGVTALELTADNLGYEPNGDAASGALILGAAGNDSLTGGVGHDSIFGLAGDDVIDGGDGAAGDSAYGDLGNDTLLGGDGADYFSGDAGNDRLVGAASDDTLLGGAGNDTLLGGDGNDSLLGGLGTDSMVGGSGTDLVSYESAAAAIIASLSSPGTNAGEALGDTYSGIENLRGSAFADRLVAGAGANRLEGLAGSDQLVGGSGADTLDGGAGTLDIASYENAGLGLTASLAAPGSNTGDALGDVYIGIEALRGSNFVDTLTGDANANRMIGLAGNDTLNGSDGSDTLIGGAGADAMFGGNNSDTASYEAAATGVTLFLLAPAGNTGEAAGDTFSAVENLRGSAFADRLTAGVGTNTLDGFTGDDTLDGGAGGNDRLIGGLGADRLTGGSAADSFIYKTLADSTALSTDLITDFSQAQQDRVDLSLIDANPGLAGNQAFAWVGTAAFASSGTGQVRYGQADGNTFVEVDTGDGIADMRISLTGLVTLTNTDFLL